jgi:hypothetical protein
MPQVPRPHPVRPAQHRPPYARRPAAHPPHLAVRRLACDGPAAHPPARPLTTDERGGLTVIVSVSIVLLLGVLVGLLIRYSKLRFWQALVCILFGFYAATSPVAPYVRTAVTAVGRLLSGITL